MSAFPVQREKHSLFCRMVLPEQRSIECKPLYSSILPKVRFLVPSDYFSGYAFYFGYSGDFSLTRNVDERVYAEYPLSRDLHVNRDTSSKIATVSTRV